MYLNLTPPPFGRSSRTVDAVFCSHSSHASSHAPAGQPHALRSAGRTAFLLALCAALPLTSFGARWSRQRHNYSGAALSGLTCSKNVITGAGTDACTVTLNAASGSATTVSLRSSDSALAVPGSVSVAAGATSASFSVSASAVSSSQSATLTATSGRSSVSFAVQLNAAASPALTLGSSSVAFGKVTENTTATQSVTLTSSGTSPVTIQSIRVTGTGFGDAGVSVPVTLNPNQTATLDVQFTPTTTTAVTGTVAIGSNASNGATLSIALSGTGTSGAASHSVDLSWQAPANSPDPVDGYNVYRATGSGAFQRLNASTNVPVSYTDSTVQSGTTYRYEVTSVDASGVESPASNVYTATIP